MYTSARIVILCVLMALILSVPMMQSARAGKGETLAETYVVLYRDQAVPADAARVVDRAGGDFVYAYNAIGVVIARSDSLSFRDNLLADSRVENAVSTARFGTKLRGETTDDTLTPRKLSISSSTFGDPFSSFQWDMVQIHVPEALSISGGSPSVIVGDIDTGLDKDHPDLIPNIDFSRSVSCESGAPNPSPSAWDDRNGHGTHTAGTIAAAANGIGIVGVAPNVKIAGIKASTDEGFFFPEMVVCAFVWAAEHQINVTNNSYFADPFYFNCHNDPVQRAIWKAEQRAIRYAQSRGVTVVAAAGNFSDDLAHPTRDIISPDFPPGSEEERDVRNNCVVIPVEIPGVIGVSANGSLGLKSFYSNYGVGVVQVIAPGGDSILQRTNDAGGGRVLSTFPADGTICNPRRRIVDPNVRTAVYCWLQGTSMASPHVAGVAALVASRGKLNPGEVAAFIQQTADSVPCPSPEQVALYAPFPSVSNEAPQQCQGDSGYNSWFGHGLVNALNAVQP